MHIEPTNDLAILAVTIFLILGPLLAVAKFIPRAFKLFQFAIASLLAFSYFGGVLSVGHLIAAIILILLLKPLVSMNIFERGKKKNSTS